MIGEKAELLRQVILEVTGAAVDVDVDETGVRQGLRVHFHGWTRQEGPVFGLVPSGLNRHIVELQFGSYARPCVDQIVGTATAERYAVARGLVAQLASRFEVIISPDQAIKSWEVCPDMKIQVTLKGIRSQHNDDAVAQSARTAMVPLIAAIAELMGCEDTDPDPVGDVEGNIEEAVVRRRERSRRNRFLCLSVHGEKCAICGLNPDTVYGLGKGKILEVHHIEPLSEVLQPRVYDPLKDLLPLCPNCHRAIHGRIPAYTPDELRSCLLNS